MNKNGTLTAALVAAVAGLALVASTASAQVFSASPGLAVPAMGSGGASSGVVLSTITVAGGPASINDINVVFDITHTYCADLEILLIPPGGGSFLKLTTDNGGSADNFTFTRFDDLANVAVTAGVAPFNSNFRPEGGGFMAGDTWVYTSFPVPATALANLAGFNGTDANGDWTLVIGDDTGGDIGTLNYWSLEFNGAVDSLGPPPTSVPQSPAATLTLSATNGLIGSSVNAFVTVTPGTNPVSTGLAVSCNAASIDGGTVTLLDNGVAPDVAAGDLIFSGTLIVGPSAPFGSQILTGNVIDAQGRTASATRSFTVRPNPPSNDECSSPIEVFDGPNSVSNLNATSDGSEDCASTGFEVYYTYTATSTGSIQINTCAGETFDNALAVYDACDGTELACNDDFCDAQSRVDLDVVAGQTLLIRLGSFAIPGSTILTIAPSVTAQNLESGDAGDLPSSAQTPTGTNPFSSLGGNIDVRSDVDMFLINICDFANFSATTLGTGTGDDTRLFLFNLDGTGVAFSDDLDTEFGSTLSTLTSTFVTANGDYYLAVSRWDVDPVDESFASIWNDSPSDIERQPDGPGAAGAVVGWVGLAVTTGAYQVNFTGTCFAGGSGPTCEYDFNQDENIDLTDAQQMAQVFVGLLTPEANWLDGDLNGDENADLTDAQLLAAFVVSGNCGL